MLLHHFCYFHCGCFCLIITTGTKQFQVQLLTTPLLHTGSHFLPVTYTASLIFAPLFHKHFQNIYQGDSLTFILLICSQYLLFHIFWYFPDSSDFLEKNIKFYQVYLFITIKVLVTYNSALIETFRGSANFIFQFI